MANTVLIISIWLSGLGPQIATQPMTDGAACERAMNSAAQMLIDQARSNLTAPHSGLQQESPTGSGETVLRTGMGREIARLRCVSVSPGHDKPKG